LSGRWVDLREAAKLLGASTEAVRKRAARGSLRSDRQDGRVLVWVDEDQTEGVREAQVDREALLETKDETIRVLEEQLKLRAEEITRRDVIISQLTARILEIEAPPGEPASSQSREEAAQGAAEGVASAQQQAGQVGTGDYRGYNRPPDTAEGPVHGGLLRPWWRRVFGR
jgi:hypothetical protein